MVDIKFLDFPIAKTTQDIFYNINVYFHRGKD